MSDMIDPTTQNLPRSLSHTESQSEVGTSIQKTSLETLNQALEQLPDALRPWSWQLAQRNVRGARVAVWLVLALYPLFGVLDYIMAPQSALPYLFSGRVLVVLASLAMLGLLRTQWFLARSHFASASYMYLVGLGITFMVSFMGGLSSPYYAGLNLVMIGCGLLFVWPKHVCYTIHGCTVLSWLIPNLIWGEVGDPVIAASNGLFLFATACIVTTGQIFNYQRLFAQYNTQRDLSEAQHNLVQAHDKLQQLDAFKSRFFANITHELKTPLALILSSLELLLKGELGQTLDEQKQPINLMQRHGVKLLKLINDLLDLTKLEESSLKLKVTRVNMIDWTRDLIQEMKPLAERKGIRVSFSHDLTDGEIHCDPERMERVLVNLLSNATKFTDSGGEIRIQVRDHHDDQNSRSGLLISVQDTGRGFKPEHAEKIFGRFFQTDMGSKRKYGGTGIGLALSQELVELHGGLIWAEGEEGVGATFNILLKRGFEHFDAERITLIIKDTSGLGEVDEHDISHAVALSADRAMRFVELEEASERRVVERDSDEDERPATVLIAEDNPDITRLLHLALRKHFKVVAAPDGAQAIKLLERFQPDLVITDLMMPEVDGMELTEIIKRDPRYQATPILMLSARDGVEDEMVARGYPADAYMSKPFSTRKLSKLARSIIEQKAVQRTMGA